MHGNKRETRNQARIPKLSEKPAPGTERYYTSFRGPIGSARRQRFIKDHKESELLYRRRVVETYDDSADIVIRYGSWFKGDLSMRPIHHQIEQRVESPELACTELTLHIR